jgi:hypothetical protein
MLNLRIVRGPLRNGEDEAILKEYNRLTFSRIPLTEFVHWVRNGPAGPAWHAILETDEQRIVGHTSLIPLRTAYGSPGFVAAKSEYSFTHEDFRSTPIREFEAVKRPKFLILVDQLFRSCQKEGWGPFFVSTAQANHPLSRRVGCRAANFPLWECLLVLRPLNAARETPHLSARQRAMLFAAGAAQQISWSIATPFLAGVNGVRQVALDGAVEPESHRLAFFEDPDSLRWRYQEEQYVRFGSDSAAADYLVAKRGSADRYLRVCQWSLGSTSSIKRLVLAMLRPARADKAMGIRWAVYDDGETAARLVGKLRNMGFLCVRRMRTVMIHSKEEQYATPVMWKMNDSLFSFDP